MQIMSLKRSGSALFRISFQSLYRWITNFVLPAILVSILAIPALAAGLSCKDIFPSNSANKASNSELFLIKTAYQKVEIRNHPSPGVSNRLIEEARQLHLNNDFKFLSDLREKELTSQEKAAAFRKAEQAAGSFGDKTESRKAYVSSLLGDLFESGPELMEAPPQLSQAKWQLKSGTRLRQATVDYIENTWKTLIKKTPLKSRGSLIPLPFPVAIPGARFQESYYWDSYFAIKALISTKRWDLAAMQVENFLFMIENYGLVPNGMRDYYLTRSQPPLLSSMVRDVVEGALKEGRPREEILTWLRDKALPLLKKDYHDFWMNPQTRLDAKTGLNHHWDANNKPREERHGTDQEEALGKTYRDVRAEAESGKDFTDAFEGQTSRIAPVLLNSVLYKVETDLAWMEKFLGQPSAAQDFSLAAQKRKQSMDRFLWDPSTQTYRDYHLDRQQQVRIVTADIFTPLWAGAASPEQALGVRKQLSQLEVRGGIMSSTVASGKQWDAPYAWAPHQFFAIQGLRNYGQAGDALRIANKWLEANENVFADKGVLLEKIDAVRASTPVEHGDKYETQQGFLWTNAVYLWALTNVVGVPLSPR